MPNNPTTIDWYRSTKGTKVERVKLVGHSNLRDLNGDALENRIEIEVDGGMSRVTADSPMPTKFRPPVESDSPDVAKFLRKWADDIEATARFTARRNQMPFSDPKPKDRRISRTSAAVRAASLDDYGLVPCPSCQGEGWTLCELCGGDARVTRLTAREWRDNA